MKLDKKRINRISLILRPTHTPQLKGLLPGLIELLINHNKSVQFLDSEILRLEKLLSPELLSSILLVDSKKLMGESDLIISLGGDGTIIHICRHNHLGKVPIFGVNLGHLGFIAEFTKSELYHGLELAIQGKLHIGRANLFSVKVIDKNKSEKFHEYFFNDVVVTKNHISRIFTLSLYCEKELIYHLAGDGLIVSSPLGSTAYSLAAGGPIVGPEVHAMVLTPICPHSLTHRPLVIPDNKMLTISIPRVTHDVVLTLDGQSTVMVCKGDMIQIQKEKHKKVHLLLNPERTYYQKLKEKFAHGQEKFRT